MIQPDLNKVLKGLDLSKMTQMQEDMVKQNEIITFGEDVAFRRSDFKRAKPEETGVRIYFQDGDSMLIHGEKLQDVLKKMK